MVGELDAGNPHVPFDEGVQETCDMRNAPVPYSTGLSIFTYLAPAQNSAGEIIPEDTLPACWVASWKRSTHLSAQLPENK